MRVAFACLAIAAALGALPAAAQDTTAVPTNGSYLRIEYTRYFSGRREIVDSAEAARAHRWRELEARGELEEITATHVVLRRHDRTFTVPRWSVDRAWMFVPAPDADHPASDAASWGVGSVVIGTFLGAFLMAQCGGWHEGYCGLSLGLGLVSGVGFGALSALVAAGDEVDDWIAVDL